MRESENSATYRPSVIALHWGIAGGIVLMFGLGLYMTNLPLSPDKLRYYSWHKWGGVTIFLFTNLRLAWRLSWYRTWRAAYLSSTAAPQWEQTAAHWVHRVLYLLMLVIPVSGWLMSSAKGVPTVYLGLWQLPDLLERNAALGKMLLNVHISLNCILASLVMIHVCAALKHHFINRDEVLTRMLPCLKVRSFREAQR